MLLGLAANRVVKVVVEFHHWSVSHRRVQRVMSSCCGMTTGRSTLFTVVDLARSRFSRVDLDECGLQSVTACKTPLGGRQCRQIRDGNVEVEIANGEPPRCFGRRRHRSVVVPLNRKLLYRSRL